MFKTIVLALLITLIGLLLFVSCNNERVTNGNGFDNDNPNPDDGGGNPPAVNVIDADGGELTFASGMITFDFPAGAVANETTISTSKTSDFPADAGILASTVYEFGPDDSTFDVPVQVTFKYTDDVIPAGVTETSLAIATVAGDAWQTVAGSVVNIVDNTVTAPLLHFSTFGIRGQKENGGGGGGIDIDNPGAGQVVWNEITYDQNAWIVDTPELANDFTDITEAIDYLDGLLEPTQKGLAVVATSRTLEAETLDFNGDITLVYVDGVSPRLKGNGGTLFINATGAVNISGFVVEGGAEINANRSAYIDGNSFSGPLTVNFGATIGTASLPSSVGNNRHPSDAASGSGSVSGNTVTGSVAVNYKGDFATTGTYGISQNTADSVTLDAKGAGELGGSVEVSVEQNIAPNITARAKLKETANLNVSGHQDATLVNGEVEFGAGDAAASFESNTTTTAEIEAYGVKGTVEVNNNTATDAKFKTKGGDITTNSKSNTYVTYAVEVTDEDRLPDLKMSEEGISVSDELTFNADSVPLSGKCRLGLKDANLNDVTASAKCEATYEFLPGTQVGGDAYVDVKAATTTAKFEEARVGGDLYLKVNDSARLDLVSVNATMDKNAGVDLAVTSGLTVNFDATKFGTGFLGLGIGMGRGGSQYKGKSASQAGDEVVIRNCEFTTTGMIAPIFIQFDQEINVPVTIENNTISANGFGIVVNEVDAPVKITGNTLTNAGIALDGDIEGEGSSGVIGAPYILSNNTVGAGPGFSYSLTSQDLNSVTVSDSSFTPTGSASGISCTAGQITMTNCTVDEPGMGMMSLICSSGPNGKGVLHLEGGTISGIVSVLDNSQLYASGTTFNGMSLSLAGGSYASLDGGTFNGTFVSTGIGCYLHASGNTFNGGSMMDGNMSGGFLNDPMDNDGLDPYSQISCQIDFNGNGCQDYPPPSDEKDDEGKCYQDGIPVPSYSPPA